MQEYNPVQRELKNKKIRRRRIWLGIIIFLLLVIGGLSYFFLNHLLSKTQSIFSGGKSLSLLSITQASSNQLAGQSQGRTNIMVYGLTADGCRTDSMILVSYYWKENKVVTLNIPRDLWTTYNGYEGKIVSLYAYSLNGKCSPTTKSSVAPQYVSDYISKEYDIPINYWVVANFNAMTQLVNSIGGIEVDNPTAFTDYEYPNANYTGYLRPAPSFPAGELHLDGSQALIFSRSRHSTVASEGTDFARSIRQEQVIQAILTKMKSQGVLTNIGQINNYLNIMSQNIYTDLTPTDVVTLAESVNKLDLNQDYLKTNWNTSTSTGFICDAQIPYDGYDQDALLYGVPGDCTNQATTNDNSVYHQDATNYIANLLKEGENSSVNTTDPNQ